MKSLSRVCVCVYPEGKGKGEREGDSQGRRERGKRVWKKININVNRAFVALYLL